MRALVTLWALTLVGCATPHRPPTVAPQRVEMERLAQRHFLHGEASQAERDRLARLLDLHGRGAEAALLEAPDDPARAERAWFAGAHTASFTTAEAARARLPAATARYAEDPRAIRTLWLLSHAAGLHPHFLLGLANRWRADWPASAEARVAQRLSRPVDGAAQPAIDLDAWARAHPLDVAALRAADARWRAPADLAGAPRWAAARVLAAWRAGAFDVHTTLVPRLGPIVVRRARLDHVPTAVDRAVRRLDVRAWGPAVLPHEGAPTPVAAEGGWMASVVGVPARGTDTWAPSAGPRWASAAWAPAVIEAALHWRLTPQADGWRGTLTGWGLAPAPAGLLALYPNLTIAEVRRLPARGGRARWRARVRFDGSPTRSLLDDTQIEALGGPIATRTLAQADARVTDLRLPAAQVDLRLTTPDAGQPEPARLTAEGWQQVIGPDGAGTIRRALRRPRIDWTAATFTQRRAPAQALQAALADWAASAPPKLRRLIGASAPDLED